jgi:hypothetical protein
MPRNQLLLLPKLTQRKVASLTPKLLWWRLNKKKTNLKDPYQSLKTTSVTTSWSSLTT